MNVTEVKDCDESRLRISCGDWDLEQLSDSNKVNEIVNITNVEGNAWIDPVYNRAGNMTTMPQPNNPEAGYTATYDAWNLLVRVETATGKLAEYQYDAAKRRTVKQEYINDVFQKTIHFYYTEPSQWQVVEQRLDSDTTAEQQFIWGLRYIDDLLLRDRDADHNGSLEERFYALQDANWNVTGIVNPSGGIYQRFSYDPYGRVTFLGYNWVPTTDFYFWNVLFAGYRCETTTGLYHVRHRVYNTKLGTWVQRDPITQEASITTVIAVHLNELIRIAINLYAYSNTAPIEYIDSFGMNPIDPSDICQKIKDCETIYEALEGGMCKDGYTIALQIIKEPGKMDVINKRCLKNCDPIQICLGGLHCKIGETTFKNREKTITNTACVCKK